MQFNFHPYRSLVKTCGFLLILKGSLDFVKSIINMYKEVYARNRREGEDSKAG